MQPWPQRRIDGGGSIWAGTHRRKLTPSGHRATWLTRFAAAAAAWAVHAAIAEPGSARWLGDPPPVVRGRCGNATRSRAVRR